ncbi:unnamed protein product [Prorocentrum cordatum]|uniref:Uncharacterized protein n=1 Tax=Prorocentrum cordatum TaxID=2364126 RepID=A0ABN9URE5_9DINO|nr:unnamed protein product [Polarella glacialis]
MAASLLLGCCRCARPLVSRLSARFPGHKRDEDWDEERAHLLSTGLDSDDEEEAPDSLSDAQIHRRLDEAKRSGLAQRSQLPELAARRGPGGRRGVGGGPPPSSAPQPISASAARAAPSSAVAAEAEPRGPASPGGLESDGGSLDDFFDEDDDEPQQVVVGTRPTPVSPLPCSAGSDNRRLPGDGSGAADASSGTSAGASVEPAPVGASVEHPWSVRGNSLDDWITEADDEL